MHFQDVNSDAYCTEIYFSSLAISWIPSEKSKSAKKLMSFTKVSGG